MTYTIRCESSCFLSETVIVSNKKSNTHIRMPLTDNQKLARAARRKRAREKNRLLKVIVEGKNGPVEVTGTQKKKGDKVLRLARDNPMTGIYGKGDYFLDLHNSLKAPTSSGKSTYNNILSSLGGGIAEMLAEGSGPIGTTAGGWLSQLFGLGAYKVKKNSFMEGFSELPGLGRPPQFMNAGDGTSDMRMIHAEYISDITSTTLFGTNDYLLNPGNPKLHALLSQFAQYFEMYRYEGVCFVYKTLSATAVGTTTSGMGSVMMATDYDVYDNNFTNKKDLLDSEFGTDCVPYKHMIHPVECDPSRLHAANLFVQPGVTDITEVSGDARLDFWGKTTVATQGQQSPGDTIGELWITYDVVLSRPILESLTTNNVPSYHAAFITSGENGGFTLTNQTSTDNLTFGVAFSGSGSNAVVTMTNVNGAVGKFILELTVTYRLTHSPPPVYVVPSSTYATSSSVTPVLLLVGNTSSFTRSVDLAISDPSFTVANITFCFQLSGDVTETFSIWLPDVDDQGQGDIVVTPIGTLLSDRMSRKRNRGGKATNDVVDRLNRIESALFSKLERKDTPSGKDDGILQKLLEEIKLKKK